MIIARRSGTIPITLDTPPLPRSVPLDAADPLPFVTDPVVRDLAARVARSPVPSSGLPSPSYRNGSGSVRLYAGDALELLRALPDGSVDLVFADPPYFLSGGGMTCKNGRAASVNKGAWDAPLSLTEMHDFNVQWLRECRRLLKADGSLWVSGTAHNIYSVGWALQTLGYKILNDIAWYKVNPPPNLSCRYFTHATETLLWARPNPKGRHTFQYEEMKADNGGKQMQSLWRIPPPLPWEKRHGKHPTQKPEALLSRIIRAASVPGHVVLDPFCGGGTTAVVCARLGRGCIGIDQEPDYLALAARRLRDEEADALDAPEAAFHVEQMTAPRYLPPRPRWENIVSDALRTLGGEADLSAINQTVAEKWGADTTATWVCTIRRVVRQSPRIVPVARGRYKLIEGLLLDL